jgi:hypothetical protein
LDESPKILAIKRNKTNKATRDRKILEKFSLAAKIVARQKVGLPMLAKNASGKIWKTKL